MDSDDERELELQGTRATYYPHTPSISVKLYDIEECEAKIIAYQDAVRWRLIEEDTGEAPSYPALEDISCIWRFRRFVEAIKGFHKGSLDLTGRHKPRYESLMRRLPQFVDEVMILRQHYTEIPMDPIVLANGIEVPSLSDWHIEPMSLAEDFCNRWKMKVLVPSEMFRECLEVCKLLEHPQPMFQRLTLLDMPPELIHMIMAACPDARALGATCRTLHDISLSYIFKNRAIMWACLPGCNNVDTEDPEVLIRYLKSQTEIAKEKFLRQISFLLQRTDILQAITRLYVSSFWPTEAQVRAGLAEESDEGASFTAPIWRGMSDVMSQTHNVSSLLLNAIPITRAMVEGMAAMPQLHTLELLSCRCAPTLRMRQWTERPMLPTVRNATFILDTDADGALALMSVFPSVRSLALIAGANQLISLRGLVPGGQCNPFRSAERLIMKEFDIMDFGRRMLIAQRPPDGGVRLTHLKLEVAQSLTLDELAVLLIVLRGAPLRTLSLEGLGEVRGELFGHLALHFPQLQSLTLVRRESERQLRTNAAAWPGTTWEYAQRLAAFPNLRHFGWNFQLGGVHGTPADLPYIEAGCWPDRGWGTEIELYFDEWDCIARLFRAYRPSLESLTFLTRGMPGMLEVSFNMHQDERGLNIQTWKLGDRGIDNIRQVLDDANPGLDVIQTSNPWQIN